jgi:predicted RNase H-like nuclease (RuvC/YqgF family)
MEAWQRKFESIEKEVIALVHEIKALREENHELKKDLTDLKRSQDDKKLESDLAAKRDNFVKLAKSDSSEGKQSEELKVKIEAYIRKIDKCLEYLGDGE